MLNKAQVSVEFLMVIGVVALIFVVAISLIFGFIGHTLQNKENIALQELGDTILREANLAKSVDANYETEFELPVTVEGIPYQIEVNPYNPPDSLYSEIQLSFNDSNSKNAYKKVIFLYNVNVISIKKGLNIIKKKGDLFYICSKNSLNDCVIDDS